MGSLVFAADLHSDFGLLEVLLSRLSADDTLVLVGDLFGMDWPVLRQTAPDAILSRIEADYRRLASRLEGVRHLTVRGNWDPDFYYDFFGDRDLNGRVVECCGFALTGLNLDVHLGSPKPMPDEWFQRASPAPDPEILARASVWVSHLPPHGVLDEHFLPEFDIVEHIGNPLLASLLGSMKPDHVVCGHLHRSAEAAVEGTRIHLSPARNPFRLSAPHPGTP